MQLESQTICVHAINTWKLPHAVTGVQKVFAGLMRLSNPEQRLKLFWCSTSAPEPLTTWRLAVNLNAWTKAGTPSICVSVDSVYHGWGQRAYYASAFCSSPLSTPDPAGGARALGPLGCPFTLTATRLGPPKLCDTAAFLSFSR